MATSFALARSREAIATTEPSSLRCVAGMTFSRAILAVLNTPQRIFFIDNCDSGPMGRKSIARAGAPGQVKQRYQSPNGAAVARHRLSPRWGSDLPSNLLPGAYAP